MGGWCFQGSFYPSTSRETRGIFDVQPVRLPVRRRQASRQEAKMRRDEGWTSGPFILRPSSSILFFGLAVPSDAHFPTWRPQVSLIGGSENNENGTSLEHRA